MAETSYAIALGSNRRHGRYGDPPRILAAAIEEVGRRGLKVERRSRIRITPALGPAGRRFANAALVVSTKLGPAEVLQRLKSVERAFGRRRGRRWGPRVLDLDIILWSAGCWAQPGLIIPHREFRERAFVLEPLNELASDWRDPITGATVRQLLVRHRKPHPRARS
jgi:2-amino-4-hydroxy-6-hydroxymethyldihydropteridine diphosphokinase